MTPRTRAFLVIAIAGAGLLSVAPLLVQATPQQPASDTPPAQPDPKAPSSGADPELRKQFIETFQRRLENRKREIEKLEQALKLLQEGKTIEEVRQIIPDLPRFARGENREAMQSRMERFARGEGGWGADVNQLGPGGRPSGGMERSGGPGHAQEPPRAPTADERAAIQEVLASISPTLLRNLNELEKKDAPEADRKYAEALPRLRWLLELHKRDPVAYDLKLKDIKHGREAYEQAREIVKLDAQPSASAAERQRHEAAMRDALLAQYNVRTQSMRHEADRMQDRSADLLKQIEKRDADAGPVIDKNMKDMLDRERRHAEAHREHRDERRDDQTPHGKS